MPKNNELVVEEIPEDDDDDFDDTDYGFIIDANGDLKTMMLPEDLMDDPPRSIKKILRIFFFLNNVKIKNPIIKVKSI
jgi:hypothetical protein